MATQNSLNNASYPFATTALTVDPGASGNSAVQFSINASAKFKTGVDDSASDAYKISHGSALGTNDTFIMTTAGQRTMPLQPAFLAIITTTKTNVTGNSVDYTFTADSVIFDQGSNYSGSTFTAPVTGRYRLNTSMFLTNVSSANTTGWVRIVTTNRNYFFQYNVAASRDVTNNTTPLYMTTLADMSAGDTAHITIEIDLGSQTVGVGSNGSTDPRTWFSGNLEV